MNLIVDLKEKDQGPTDLVARSKQNQIIQLIRSWFVRPWPHSNICFLKLGTVNKR